MLVAWVWLVDTTSVCPSGSARATRRVPTEPEAPAWFSTTTDCPSAVCSSRATIRATTSVGPPAG
jgi:hypothetical protein